MSDDVSWSFEPVLSADDLEYDIAFISRPLAQDEVTYLVRHVRAYCLFVNDALVLDEPMDFLMRSRRGRLFKESEIPQFLKQELRNYYAKPYGEKFNGKMLAISPGFSGTVKWNGNSGVVLTGLFGSEFKQVAFWRCNIPIEQGQAIDFWFEYHKEGSVEVELEIFQFPRGSVSTIQSSWKFSKQELLAPVTVDNDKFAGPVFVSLNARGTGVLTIVALHDRHSRRSAGSFLPGGRRWVTSSREELFTYFDPSDLKPPLVVYFSGYKTQEGFEGYRMMRRMGCPFLLVSDPRLQGGDFYLGNEEYENLVCKAIREAMDSLGLSADDVVLTGLSMGSFGALYYATVISCGNVIVGKPLLSLGNVAKNERLLRPGVFPTSLDVLWKECGSLNNDAVERLNHRFWSHFDATDWSNRTIYTAYMLEDDYDQDAYQTLLLHVRGSGAKVIGKGLHGRHNDDTSGIVSWFVSQIKRVLRGYGRGQSPDGDSR